MSAMTATIEALTAEVRVLMVGSRQVTLSVAKQLDFVALEELTVFGRVRVEKGNERMVIGANREGVLCLSSWQRERPHIWIDIDDGHITRCRAHRPIFDETVGAKVVRLTFSGRQIEFLEHHTKPCADHFMSSQLKCPLETPCTGWNPNGYEEEIASQIHEYDETMTPHRAAAAAPLIVLAGLR